MREPASRAGRIEKTTCRRKDRIEKRHLCRYGTLPLSATVQFVKRRALHIYAYFGVVLEVPVRLLGAVNRQPIKATLTNGESCLDCYETVRVPVAIFDESGLE
jgi:hypothetical protein